MGRYWVIGGEYEDTRFETIVGGGSEQRHGPFAHYEQAKAKWQELAWSSVDNAHARYRIEEEAALEPQAAMRWWVVGGRYRDTGFRETESGSESWIGPFESFEAAKTEWAARAWATVDDALSRYRIEKLAGDPPGAPAGVPPVTGTKT